MYETLWNILIFFFISTLILLQWDDLKSEHFDAEIKPKRD